MLTVVTPPSVEPLTVAEARERLGLGSTPSDDTVTAWIKSERQWVEEYLGRRLITQTVEWVVRGFPGCGDGWLNLSSGTWAGSPGEVPKWSQYFGELGCWGFVLPAVPVQAIESVSYVDGNGSSQTLATNQYRLIGRDPAYLLPAIGVAWPFFSPREGVTIQFAVGYGTMASSVPEPIRQAIALRVGRGRAVSQQSLFLSSETVDGLGSFNYTAGTGASRTIGENVDELLMPYRAASGIF